VNVDTGEFAALTAEVAALSRKISALNGKVTVMGNALKHDGGLIQATHAFSIGLEIGERERAEGHLLYARRLKSSPRVVYRGTDPAELEARIREHEGRQR
jgi:hypothetical protein